MIARRGVAAAATVAAVVGGLLFATAAPAGAHGLGGLKPTNYETVLEGVRPRVPGVRVKVVDLGTNVELTNRGPTDVVVLGYDREPYLRVGRRGVFQNQRSPATYLNRSTTITSRPPARANADAPPEWKRLSTGVTARWHDHRAHFMGTSDPPEVARAPDARHVIDNFRIPLRVGAQDAAVRGQVVYVPPPSPWPWVIGAVVLAAVVFLLARSRSWRTVFVVVLALLTVTEMVHVIGLWGGSTASAGTKLGESAYSIAGVLLGLLGLGWIWRKGAESAVPLVLVAAIFLFVAGGMADVTTLGNSQVPSTLPAGVARLLVTVTLGLGGGLALAAALRLRPTTPAAPARRPRARVTS
jgi:hypothetical protein